MDPEVDEKIAKDRGEILMDMGEDFFRDEYACTTYFNSTFHTPERLFAKPDL